MSTSSRQNSVRPSVTGYCSFGQVFSQRVPPSGVKQEKPSSSASALSLSSAGPRFIREIVVVSRVVSARGSAQLQVRAPSAPTPEGPKAASLRGMSPSSASTASDKIARQSVGRATGAVVGVGVGDGVLVSSLPAVWPSVGLGEVSPPSPACGVHAVRPTRRRKAAAAPASRGFISTPYCSSAARREWNAVQPVGARRHDSVGG